MLLPRSIPLRLGKFANAIERKSERVMGCCVFIVDGDGLAVGVNGLGGIVQGCRIDVALFAIKKGHAGLRLNSLIELSHGADIILLPEEITGIGDKDDRRVGGKLKRLFDVGLGGRLVASLSAI